MYNTAILQLLIELPSGAAARSINVSDSTAVTDSKDIIRDSSRDVTVSDSSTITENIVLLILTLFIIVSDSSAVTENIPTSQISYGVDVEVANSAYFVNGVKVV